MISNIVSPGAGFMFRVKGSSGVPVGVLDERHLHGSSRSPAQWPSERSSMALGGDHVN